MHSSLNHTVILRRSSQHVRPGDGDVIRQTGNATAGSSKTDVVVAPSVCLLDRRHHGRRAPQVELRDRCRIVLSLSDVICRKVDCVSGLVMAINS